MSGTSPERLDELRKKFRERTHPASPVGPEGDQELPPLAEEQMHWEPWVIEQVRKMSVEDLRRAVLACQQVIWEREAQLRAALLNSEKRPSPASEEELPELGDVEAHPEWDGARAARGYWAEYDRIAAKIRNTQLLAALKENASLKEINVELVESHNTLLIDAVNQQWRAEKAEMALRQAGEGGKGVSGKQEEAPELSWERSK